MVPGDWIKAVIIPIFKKGSRLDCAIYRGISLLSIVGKVFGWIILNNRVKAITDVKVMDEQGGFRTGRGCKNQILVVKQIVENTIEKNKKTYMAFVDLEKAYNNVSREKLWVVLDKYGIKGKLLRAIQALYVGSKACVKVGGLTSQEFEVGRGVRQGCTLSPWLFNLFMDNVMREARGSFVDEVQLSTGEVGVLLFADDMVVMADSKEGLQHNLKAVSDMLNKWELKINWRKTKVMRVARDREEFEVKIGDEVIEQVDTMKYLGVMVSNDGGMEKAESRRCFGSGEKEAGELEGQTRRNEL